MECQKVSFCERTALSKSKLGSPFSGKVLSKSKVHFQKTQNKGRTVECTIAPVANGTTQTFSGFTADELKKLEGELLVHTYARAPVVFIRGQGSKLYDTEGKEYVDMAGGIAVNSLGHGDASWVHAVTEQAATLAHVSNLYYTVPQILLAKRLVDGSFADRVFYTNSGTEANEAAIKFSRKYQRELFGEGNQENDGPATEFVSFSNCFHGRTMGALALTYKVQYRTPFEPVMPGVSFGTWGDLESVKSLVKKGKTAAIFVEPVQGEGGVFPATQEFLQGLRQICDDSGALLVFDEVRRPFFPHFSSQCHDLEEKRLEIL